MSVEARRRARQRRDPIAQCDRGQDLDLRTERQHVERRRVDRIEARVHPSPSKPDTVEAWSRSADNPVGGWYGMKKGLRGRFGNYAPPVLEALALAEVENNARNNRMRAL